MFTIICHYVIVISYTLSILFWHSSLSQNSESESESEIRSPKLGNIDQIKRARIKVTRAAFQERYKNNSFCESCNLSLEWRIATTYDIQYRIKILLYSRMDLYLFEGRQKSQSERKY
jgi:hypothetical protein